MRESDIYRGYELENQGDGTVAVYTLDGELVTYENSAWEARKVIDGWHDAP